MRPKHAGQHTYMRYIQRTHERLRRLDDAANGASAALAARQAAPCEPCVRNDTAGANAPTGGGQPRHKQRIRGGQP